MGRLLATAAAYVFGAASTPLTPQLQWPSWQPMKALPKPSALSRYRDRRRSRNRRQRLARKIQRRSR